MKRSADITALLVRSNGDLSKIEGEYQASLAAKQISADLRIDIKNLCGNLRSVLDYVAHEMREKHCPGQRPSDRFYFPISSSQADFQYVLGRSYPGLAVSSPPLAAYLESIQPWQGHSQEWLGTLNWLNNENKHGVLVEQIRSTRDEVRVKTSGGGQVSWLPSAVTFRSGVSIDGVPVDPRTQLPVPSARLNVERVTWVDFRFEGRDVSALALLRESMAGTEAIASTIPQWL